MEACGVHALVRSVPPRTNLPVPYKPPRTNLPVPYKPPRTNRARTQTSPCPERTERRTSLPVAEGEAQGERKGGGGQGVELVCVRFVLRRGWFRVQFVLKEGRGRLTRCEPCSASIDAIPCSRGSGAGFENTAGVAEVSM
jgi:hypothetical protein